MQTPLHETKSKYEYLFKTLEKGGIIQVADAVSLFRKSGLDNNVLKDVCV